MSFTTDLSAVGYPLHEFELRLAKLELAHVHSGGDPQRLAFSAYADGLPTHQFFLDRFLKLNRIENPALLVAAASGISDGSRAEAHNYLTHGLHSYKGKFFPQIVRALINTACLNAGDAVVDPFVGSGTTSLEAALMGMRGVGMDRNPLAVLIGRTKVDVLGLSVEEASSYPHVLLASLARGDREVELPSPAYLARWFPANTLRLLGHILGTIDSTPAAEPLKNLARLVLSSNLRSWSLQEPSQLRLFRRPEAPPAHALRERFDDQLTSTCMLVANSIRLVDELGLRVGSADVVQADSRRLDAWSATGTTAALITSPPYATALPYIDTDRLSIFALGLANLPDRSGLEWEMIGTREITARRRRELEQALATNADGLPDEIVEGIQAIQRANSKVEVGFRRRNLPALLYRYFADMQQVLSHGTSHLRSNGLCAIVIGDSHTVAGGRRMRIRTADFTCSVAVALGLSLEERIPMGGQSPYLPHKSNAIPDEEILLFRRAA